MSAKREDAGSSAWDRAANDAFERGDIRALTKLLLEAEMLHDVPIAAVIARRIKATDNAVDSVRGPERRDAPRDPKEG